MIITRGLRLSALAVLLGALVACQPGVRDPASIRRIIVMGDSVAHGVPPYGVPGFMDYLGEFYPSAEIIRLGAPASSLVDGYDPQTGWSNWAGQVNHWVQAGFDADLVIIQGCCSRYTSSSQWRGALDALIAKSRGNDPGNDRRVVLVTTPRMVPGTGAYYTAAGVGTMIEGSNAVIRQTPGVAVADLDFAWSVNWGPVWSVPSVGVVRNIDGLHLNHTGSREAARVVSRY